VTRRAGRTRRFRHGVVAMRWRFVFTAVMRSPAKLTRLAPGAALVIPWLLAEVALLALVAPPARATTLFGLVDTGELFVSADQGTSWTVRATLPVRDAVALAAGATASELYMASRSGSVYRSTDAGTSWTAVGAVAASDVVDLAIRPDLSLFLLTAGGAVYGSTDQGASFTALAALAAPNHVSLGPTSQYRLYALTRSGEVSESVDAGINWVAKGAISVSDAVRLRAIGSTLYVMSGTGDVYRSADAAVSWTAVGTLSQVGMTALAGDLATLIVSTGAGEVATSADGASWTWKGAINQLTVTALGTDLPATTGVDLTPGSSGLELAPPWPNPLTSDEAVTLAFRLPHDDTVGATLYDLAGRKIVERAAEPFSAGRSTVRWRLPSVRGGLYFLVLSTGSGAAWITRLAVLR